MTPTDWTATGLGFFLIISTILIIVTDIYRIMTGQNSYSFYIKTLSEKYPLIPFLFGLISGLITGILAGHWWFPTH